MCEMRIVPGSKEARSQHLRHAGPTATSGPHHRHRACYDYFRWAATASGFGDRLSPTKRPNTITNPLMTTFYHRPPLLARICHGQPAFALR